MPKNMNKSFLLMFSFACLIWVWESAETHLNGYASLFTLFLKIGACTMGKKEVIWVEAELMGK